MNHTQTHAHVLQELFYTEILEKSTINDGDRSRTERLQILILKSYRCVQCSASLHRLLRCCYRLNLPETSFGKSVNTQTSVLKQLLGFQHKLHKFPLLVVMLSFILHLYFPSLITKWS